MTKTIIAAIGLTFIASSAHATCGGYWDVGVDYDKHDYQKGTMYGANSSGYTAAGSSVDDDRDSYSFGISFRVPLGDEDCKYKRAQAAKEHALARKAEDEARYAADRAAKEHEFAISKRIDNLQRLIVTCKTEDIAICSQIDELSLELFN